MKINLFPPLLSEVLLALLAVLMAVTVNSEPAGQSQGSLPSLDADGALGGRGGWLVGAEVGQRQHHCQTATVLYVN